MKPILSHFAGALALSFAVAACIPSVEAPAATSAAPVAAPPPPAPVAVPPASIAEPAAATPVAPTPTTVAAPLPASAQAPVAMASDAFDPLPENWMDEPRTPGDWSYIQETGETFAIYRTGGESAHAIIRCDLASRQIGIGRFAAEMSSVAMRIYTETREAELTATARESRFPLVAAEVDRNNRLLDAMAVTKGNFAMQVAGMPTLYLPGWAEVTRVIEDCR